MTHYLFSRRGPRVVLGKSIPPSVQLEEDRRGMQGAWLLVASLSVFFISCIILFTIYVVLRLGPEAGELAPFKLPPAFVLTTVTMLSVSALLNMSVRAARSERHTELRRYITLSFILAIFFFIVQGFSLRVLVERMLGPGVAMQNLYGLTFFLVVLHALHVLGGVVGMTFLLFGVARGAYDHERNFPIRFCALYWHFLDVVWILMLVAFGVAAVVANRS
jgi:cytochrome c oxidase subunit III